MTEKSIKEMAEKAGILYGCRDEIYYTRYSDGITHKDLESFARIVIQEHNKLIATDI